MADLKVQYAKILLHFWVRTKLKVLLLNIDKYDKYKQNKLG